MKTLRQILMEMPQLFSGVSKKRNYTFNSDKNATKISEHGGYHIYSTNPENNHANSTIYAQHPKTGRVHMTVDLDNHQVVSLRGSRFAKIKAHDLYHHLITKHDIALKSDNDHSIGGMKTWEKLRAKPDIKMTHHLNGKQTKLHKDFADNYDVGHSKYKYSHFKAVKK